MTPATSVERWFGPRFAELHPLLQQLHREGGRLRGPVQVSVPPGGAGWVGRRLAQRLSIPAPGSHDFEVHIHHSDEGLHWDRRFGPGLHMRSLFVPVGRWPEGHFIERSGQLQLQLGVDVIEGGWHWRFRRALWNGIALPRGLLPQSVAHKVIEGDRYRFHVSFVLPVLGRVLSYEGLLDPAPTVG
jgi:hypothetical protein